MSNVITIIHPAHGEAVVGLDQWNAKFPEGEPSSGWDEATARANGWTVKGEKPAKGEK